MALRNLRSDRFGTLASVLAVALGVATVDTVLVLDLSTRQREAQHWATDPGQAVQLDHTVTLTGFTADGRPTLPAGVLEETHEDYEVMRSAIRLGSLSAFLVGALIVFFAFRVRVARRRREVALLRSLGATRRQVALVFLLEGLVIGVAGALLGLLLTYPLAKMASWAGITTTGRARVRRLVMPWGLMAGVAAVGAATAVLAVWQPVRAVLRRDVARTLAPLFLSDDGEPAPAASRLRQMAPVLLPFGTLAYVLMRPFFHDALPSLTFFVLEAVLVCAAALATVALVPQLVGLLGRLLAWVFPPGSDAVRMLTLRRVQRRAEALSWSVAGVMLVFALLVGLHLVTDALAREVEQWSETALRPYAYAFTVDNTEVPEAWREGLPPDVVAAGFSKATPWPNRVQAVRRDELVAIAKAGADPAAVALAESLGPGRVIVSRLLAERLAVGVGDRVQVRSSAGEASLEVVGLTEGLGYAPTGGAYRQSKTYALVDAAHHALLAPYTGPLDAVLILGGRQDWSAALRAAPNLVLREGRKYERARIRETHKDFVIFDLILLLTTVLAAVGVANNLVLAVHGRRREIGLYRVLGMTRRQVRRLVLAEGAVVGALGGALAVVVGVPLGYAAISALRVVSAFEVDFSFPPLYAPIAVAAALLIAVAAAWYPAQRAAALESAESVHYE